MNCGHKYSGNIRYRVPYCVMGPAQSVGCITELCYRKCLKLLAGLVVYARKFRVLCSHLIIIVMSTQNSIFYFSVD
jgi:hypothetical protein